MPHGATVCSVVKLVCSHTTNQQQQWLEGVVWGGHSCYSLWPAGLLQGGELLLPKFTFLNIALDSSYSFPSTLLREGFLFHFSLCVSLKRNECTLLLTTALAVILCYISQGGALEVGHKSLGRHCLPLSVYRVRFRSSVHLPFLPLHYSNSHSTKTE